MHILTNLDIRLFKPENIFDVLDPAPPPLVLRHVESSVDEIFFLVLNINHLLLNGILRNELVDVHILNIKTY